MPRPAVLLLAATAVSGGAGYLVTVFVAARVAPPEYAAFATFWSALFLVVGALGGIQQEVTRAAARRDATPGTAALAPFALGAALVAVALVLVTAPLWSAIVEGRPATIAAIAGGAGAYVLVAVTSGALYGVTAWVPIAVLVLVDGVLRLIGVLVALALPDPGRALEAAVVLPFPLALLIVLPVVRRMLDGVRADVALARLAGNAAAAVVAAAASAALISGFPALVAAAAGDRSADVVAPVLLALLVTRAPIVIPAMAMQSFLLVRFRSGGVRAVLVALTVVGVATLALCGLAALVGPPLLLAVFGSAYALDAGFLAVIVASSGLIAAVIVAGAGLLAASRHPVYLAGWVVALGVTLVALLVPLEFETRVAVAALTGPAVALAVQLIALGTGRSAES